MHKRAKKKPIKAHAAAPKRRIRKNADEVRKLVRAHVTKEGAGALAELADPSVKSHVNEWLSTQSLAFDSALGTPGLPMGRIVEFLGKNHSGKSTALSHLLAEVQRLGGIGYLRDQENTVDKDYFARIGVKVDELEMIQPTGPTIEHTVEAIEATVDKVRDYDVPVVVGWDTIASAPAQKELEGSFSKQQPGHAAKAIRLMCKRMVPRLAGSRILFVVLNQTYTKINTSGFGGSPEVGYGGEGLAFYASIRAHFRKLGAIDGVPGTLSKIRIWKNKVSDTTYHEVEVAIARGCGYDNAYTIYSALADRKLLSYGSAGACMVRLSETDELKWRGGWMGLSALCAREPSVYLRLVDAYRALEAPRPTQAQEAESA